MAEAGTNIDAQAQNWDDDDYDSGFESDGRQSSTVSLESRITDYRYEHGRRYHGYKEGAYWGPNDDQAADHLDIAHHLWLLTLENQLHLAPIPDNVGKVLDVGCGTGIWAIDFADQHPNTTVIGTDLSPIQPSFVPPNCLFQIDDCTDDWTFAPNTFDFIHVRSLFGCVADWPRFYREVMRALKPGGWFEQVEMDCGFKSDDGSVTSERAIGQWGENGRQAGLVMGKRFDIYDKIGGWVQEAGFEEVRDVRYKWPLGAWPQEKRLRNIGRWARLHVEEGMENWALYGMVKYMGWSEQEVKVLIAKMRNDLKDPAVHAHHEFAVVYGRKPMESRSSSETASLASQRKE